MNNWPIGDADMEKAEKKCLNVCKKNRKGNNSHKEARKILCKAYGLKSFNMISEMIDMNMIIRNLEVMTDGFLNLVILHIKPCVRPSFPHLKSAKTCLISFGLCRIL